MKLDLDLLLGRSALERRKVEDADTPAERAVRLRLRAERLAREKAERDRVAALLAKDDDRADGVSPDGGRISDLGPRIRRERGEVEATLEATLEREALDAAAARPKTRRVRRARRVWAPDALLANKTIARHHHNAAWLLEGDWQLGIEGAREAHAKWVRIGRASSTADGFNDARLAAMANCRAAEEVVGVALWPVVSWCVLSCGSLSGFAQVRRWVSPAGEPDHKRAGRHLLEALERLAEFYEAPRAFLWRDHVADDEREEEAQASRPGRRPRTEPCF